MTPIVEDLLTALSYVYEAGIKSFCYVFGHKWGEWEDDYGGYKNSPLGCHKECDRCGEFEHDSQMLKSFCRSRK